MIGAYMNKRKYYVIVIVIIGACFLYLGSKATFTLLESNVDANVSTSVAGIKLRINGVDAVTYSDGTLDNQIILHNTTWESTHIRSSKIGPGSTGTIDLTLDPTGSEVAILYEFRFVDKNIDGDKLLTFTSINSDNSTITRTSVDTYTGVISLDDINNSRTVHLTASFLFDYLTDTEGITEDNQVLDDLFEIHFHAIQYNGETITPYVDPGE